MLEERQKRLKELMGSIGSDGLILFPGVDLFYATGLMAHASERLTCVILQKDSDPIFICPSFEKSRIKKGVQFGTIQTWEEDEDPFKLLGKTAVDLDLENKQISLDNKLWFDWFLRIQKNLPKAKFVNATNVVQAARIIKAEGEIKLMQEATKIASDAIIKTFEQVTPGMTETDVSKLISEEFNLPKIVSVQDTLDPKKGFISFGWIDFESKLLVFGDPTRKSLRLKYTNKLLSISRTDCS